MTTFDLAEVSKFDADLKARRDDCDHGEGNACATIEDALLHYAKICSDYVAETKAWGQAVFTGQAAFDPAVESLLRSTGAVLVNCATDLLLHSRFAQKDCAVCEESESGRNLKAALYEINKLVEHWVTPSRGIGLSLKDRSGMSVAQIIMAKNVGIASTQ